jgi:PAS domain S-box-containing protein
MVYGWKYGLIAGLSGGALFPFYLWFNNGYPNLTTTIIYLILYCLLGLASNQKFIKDIKSLDIRFFIVFIVSVILFKIYYSFIFNYMLSLNPPFWSNKTINYLSTEILNSFFIKESINFFAFIFISSTLIKLPFVHQILVLKTTNEMKNNGKIFLYSIIFALLVWFSYFLLRNSLFHGENVFKHQPLQLALFVILAAGLIVARIIIYYSEVEIKSRFELIAAKEKAEESELMYKEKHELLSLFIKHSPIFTFIKNIQANNSSVLYASDNYVDMIGISGADMIGKTMFELFPPEFAQKITQDDIDVTNKGEILKLEENLGDRNYITIKFPIIQKKTKLLAGYTIDITDQKNSEKALQVAKEKAEESDRLKTAFLQNMSHEIRTPMNAIMGFSSLLPENFNDREKIESFSKIIELRSNDLLDIINDILDISKIESGQSTINIEPCNIKELFDELSLFLKEHKSRINKQDIKIIFQPALEDSILTVKTDKLKLKQIIINLTINALKFTETGSISCGYKQAGNKIQFYVQDSGIGIPSDKFDFIFERFSQLKHPSLHNTGGTGLGLPIVKGLVKLLGGDVWLESECNKGSTFYFTIDYTKAI